METKYELEREKLQLNVTRKFAADINEVWRAWTEAEMLDQWWGPQPWYVITKFMDFSEEGKWLYSMNGPAGEKHWSVMEYLEIKPEKFFSSNHSFCDEDGFVIDKLKTPLWEISFARSGNSTVVKVQITYQREEDLDTILEMGFKEGFAMGHSQLDELLKTI
ncbi:SRPBCC family protein [Jiulongibacter sediminis]|uniref:Activator of Hsp90 ATPase homologue 1/2-like C-terminal domain-containing protein n=1 Tax=Jiulongibacter sediminis TaxID=1605367 RepID=A0A0N8H9T3_9BACT|nr:SRPBCC domain-containing protein [Jiulongibacter sediminis]KPM48252.1 hypothetical protein AFM12_06220 [Jiulongibacter sediminis]TBX24794.1 hypothetical protein TK44_06225 [Jiulongibacter sediminis]